MTRTTCWGWLIAGSWALLSAPIALLAADDLTSLEEQALRAAVARVASSVVSIETFGGLEKVDKVLVGTGPTTGLIISPDGYIVSSAFNFVQKPSTILIGLPDGSRSPARLIATDRQRMITLLKVNVDEPLAACEGANDEAVRVGDWAIAVGRTFDSTQVNSSVGIVSAVGRVWGKAVQTDAKVSPANYGGPLVNIRGQVLGVLVPLSPQGNSEVSGVEWYDSGIGFAVPLSHVKRVLPRLQKGTDLLPGLLGVNIKQADLFADPVELLYVRPNSPAYKAGIKKGDRVVQFDQATIEQRAQLTRELAQRYAGESVKLAVLRGSQRLEFSLELADKLEPYERPLLGILPRRDNSTDGVVVREVMSGSSAEKLGLKPGDRITQVGNDKVDQRETLTRHIAALQLKQPTTLEVQRGSETLRLNWTPAAETFAIPDTLSPARDSLAADDKQRPLVGRFQLKLADVETDCTVYVPERYDARIAYGLVLYLHGNETVDADKLVERWKGSCDRDDLILLAPRSAKAAQWQASDVDAIVRAVVEIRKDYTIDAQRVVAVGSQSGGGLAFRLAYTQREHIRGVAVCNSPILGPPPDNDPEQRLSLLIATAKQPDATAALDVLRKAKFPVVTLDQGEKPRFFSNDELSAVLRWLDALDRI